MEATSQSEWITAPEAWSEFTKAHPELGYAGGYWQFHNFLRLFRGTLRKQDAIRLAKNRRWIAHRVRFEKAAFDCATGVLPDSMEPAAA